MAVILEIFTLYADVRLMIFGHSTSNLSTSRLFDCQAISYIYIYTGLLCLAFCSYASLIVGPSETIGTLYRASMLDYVGIVYSIQLIDVGGHLTVCPPSDGDHQAHQQSS